ncbi:LytTR family transcriptional regulator DNA-binding domain-containing protein [Neobacillus sp. WH10]|uniref:LytR/AlgR family response regulator transcription factor n=1 Tax=Neobacillus sp. WH10 TaxID=3047873 RepID=UPI0024C1241C|nr:LytTR family transcriptional regulator DNA-binding domain-containing protein [Neobacillus sp. WH10]WHY76520.1 LytTR family transcriptional regulator DNA-binding domain-containing protein [Neobacillus sp. WH10]
MLKVFIVDDEPLARDELSYLLKRSKQVEIAGEADNVEAALEKMVVLDIDVIFLDIQLADESGIEIANRMNQLEYPPLIVFATAYDEYALKAFELNAADYILKPFDEKRVQQTIEKLYKLAGNKKQKISLPSRQQSYANERTEKLAVSVDEKIVLVNINEILYVATQEGKTMIATEKQKYWLSDSLVTFERKLQHTPIIRVHRAYLVSIDAIVEIEPWFNSTYNLIMKDGEKVPVSRTYTKDLKQLLDF